MLKADSTTGQEPLAGDKDLASGPPKLGELRNVLSPRNLQPIRKYCGIQQEEARQGWGGLKFCLWLRQHITVAKTECSKPGLPALVPGLAATGHITLGGNQYKFSESKFPHLQNRPSKSTYYLEGLLGAMEK